MAFNNRRFALLAVLCCLAIQRFSPLGDAGVRAAVVRRQPKPQFAHHEVRKTADYDAGSLHRNQALFSLPWSRNGEASSKECTGSRCQKKRSISISDTHGAKYTVHHQRRAGTPQWISMPQNGTSSNNTAPTSSGVGGIVAIVSRNPNPNEDRTIAHLFLVQQADGTKVLDASEKDATKVFLDAISQPSPYDNDAYPVKIEIPFDNEQYCAAYDQNPPNAEPLIVQPCMENGGRMSQIFMYNRTSGDIQPTYFKGVEGVSTPSNSSSTPSSASPSASSASIGAADAGIAASSGFPSAGPSSASWSKRDERGSYPGQNVTLVFIPNQTVSNEALAAAEVQEVSTSTVTQTVVVFSSAASLSAPTPNATDATPSPASVASSSGSATMAGVTGLSVEVVGNAALSSGSPPFPLSSVGMPAVAASESPVASNSPSASTDAAPVAASVASSDSAASTTPSPSVAAFPNVATPSPSDNSASTSISSSSSSPSTRAVFERNAVAESKPNPVSTEPYLWRFKAEGRF